MWRFSSFVSIVSYSWSNYHLTTWECILDISAIDLLNFLMHIKSMKEMYLSDINDLYKKITSKLQQVCHSHPSKFFIIVSNFGWLPCKFRKITHHHLYIACNIALLWLFPYWFFGFFLVNIYLDKQCSHYGNIL